MYAQWQSQSQDSPFVCRAAIDNAKESLLKGRGAGTLAATVAASVASKVSSGSMMKVSEDSPKDKTESVKTEEKKKEDRGSRWWGVQPMHFH